ncbi:hypothetical protein BOX15_Mlig027559g3, partial [Macrostomum lignano]
CKMPKKGKGDDKKAAAEDVFDPVSVETKSAMTAILLLDSPEPEVQSKACEGIYKFAYKCEENRRFLLENGAIEGLMKLLTVEDKAIKRNALMALATMTHSPDVRRHLRTNRDDAVSALLKLLNPEEFVTTHEFAALALSNMAKEFASIPAIVENKGLELLLEVMQEDDPDVQKNAVECIALLMQDFEAKGSMKDSSGLETLLQLLESEYAIIQQLALQSLIRASQEVSNRGLLRELNALRVFVNILGKTELHDLHVLALHVISNCADEPENLQQLKENGGLPRLVAFIADRPAPPEEALPDAAGKGGKDAKGKGGGGAAAAKAKGSAKKKKGEDDSKDADVAPPQTQPDVKMHAARAIARAAKSNDGKRILHDCNAEALLVQLLTHEEDRVRVAAAQAIAVMGENFLCQEAVLAAGGLEQLVKILRLDNRQLKESSSLAIANLTTANLPICTVVANANHGLENVLGCLRHDSEYVVSNGLATLINMSADESLRQRVLDIGFVSALLTPLDSRSAMAQLKAAQAVSAYIRQPAPRKEFREAGGLDLLAPLLRSSTDEVRRAAAIAVSLLLVDRETSVEFYRIGGLEILQELNSSETKRSPHTEAAEAGLLGNNISLKYALSGKLAVTDRVPDLFYDVGQVRPGEKLAPLETYCAQPVNTRRAVLLINVQPAEETRTSENQQQDREVGTPNGRSRIKSPKGSDKSKSSNGSLGQADAPEKPAFSLPEDQNLKSYIDTAQSLMRECSNPREQILLLAKFVSDRMGGPIEHGQLMKFSYELPISQLKYSLQSNVIPMGLINAGIHYHRALLFKFLADRAGIDCTLVRGQLNRAWNEVWLTECDGARKYPPSEYVIDLINQPGKLYRRDSIEAANYKKC